MIVHIFVTHDKALGGFDMKFEVRQITDPNDPVIETVSRWICDWWGEEQDPDQMRDYYKRSVFNERLPQTFVAYADDRPVGTFQFGMGDIFVRPDLYPWLKHVYIAPEFRGNGFAAEMMKFASAKIKEMDFENFYLFTHLENFYENFGWEFVELFRSYDHEPDVQRMYKFCFK